MGAPHLLKLVSPGIQNLSRKTLFFLSIRTANLTRSLISKLLSLSLQEIQKKSIQENKVPIETEKLTITDRYNEYIMTGLRTIWGVSLERIEKDFGKFYLDYFFSIYPA